MSTTSSYPFAETMPMHTLYVGVADSARERLLPRIFELASKRFESFTAVEATGHWRDRQEPSLALRIATRDTAGVLALAQELCAETGQDSVGVELGGPYLSVRASGSAS